VSEITESNGSSSMASVCGGSLAMMDAGVPLSDHVAGIAMGLIKEGNRFAVLTDILGDEDHLGDMDFKVAGTDSGVTALQMDIKIQGITKEIMQVALAQAKDARLHILGIMKGAVSGHRQEVSNYAPRMITLKINPEKIRDVIGKGGATIRALTEETGCVIDIEDDGSVTIASVNADAALTATLERWLGPYLSGISRLNDLKRIDLTAALRAHLSWRQQQRLDRLAPTHLTVPSGSRRPIDYSGDIPVLAVRIQEMFGARETPTLAEGRQPLLIHILSPAGRPAQITRDLGGFWKNSYPAVKKELKGRYPKHHWPDDPLNARPTARVRPH
jgi:hypothetical protein